MKKLLIVNTLYFPNSIGGAELSVQSIAESLTDTFEVYVMTVAVDNKKTIEVINGVNVYRMPTYGYQYGYVPKNALSKLFFHLLYTYNPIKDYMLSKTVKEIDPNLVHTNNILGLSSVIWKIAGKLDVPVVHTIRDRGLLCPFHMFKNATICYSQCSFCKSYTHLHRTYSKHVNAVVGISSDVLDSHLKEGYFNKAKHTPVIYNGVDDLALEANKITKKQLTFGYIGSIKHFKGVEFLLESFPTNTHSRLIIAGDKTGEYAERLVTTYSSEHIEFIGRVKPSEFYEKIDVLIAPSLFREPFGRIVIEAYSAGIPVVATRRGAFPEIIDDNKTGWLFDPEDKTRLKTLIGKIINSEFNLRHMEQHCKDKYQALFTKTEMIDKYIAMYKTLCDE